MFDDRRSERSKPLYMISVAAELCGMHPQTLRVYEQKGLVNPGRSQGNTRLYSQSDIDRLNLIARLTDEGINLAGVIRILDMANEIDDKDAEIEDLQEELRKTKAELREYKTRDRITQLVPYTDLSPEQVLFGYLE